MKNSRISALFLTAFLSMTATVALLLSIPTFSLDASAVSVDSLGLPSGSSLENLVCNASNGYVSQASSDNTFSLICPVLPSKSYIFRFYSPVGTSYNNRFRLGTSTLFPEAGTTYLDMRTSELNSLVRDGDFLYYAFDTSVSDYYVFIFLFYNSSSPSTVLNLMGYMNPELFYDAEINVSVFPQRFYPGDDMLLVASNVTEENTYFSVGYRSVGDTDIINIGTFGGDSYGFNWVWSVPYSISSGSYEFIIRAQTQFQTVSVSVPFVILYSPSPVIPPETPPVSPDISGLPDTSDFIIVFPEEFVEVTYSIWDLVPYELYPLLMMTMVSLLIVALVRRRDG